MRSLRSGTSSVRWRSEIAATGKTLKILLITYYWVPCGGVPVQRWLKLTKYLPQNNCFPTVLTTLNGDYPNIDFSLLNQVSNDVTVVRVKTPSFSKILQFFLGRNEKIPYGSLHTTKQDSLLKRIIYFLRVQFIVPDARRIWNKIAFKKAEEILRSGVYNAVITTGPPHSTHLIGLKLKQKYNIKWIADFRDPWFNIHYNLNENRNIFIKKIDKYLENSVIKNADSIVAVSESLVDTQISYELRDSSYKVWVHLLLEKKAPNNTALKRKVKIIPNAFDPEDYINKTYKRSTNFRIKFVGALFADRKQIVLDAINWIDEYAIINQIDNIEFSIIGENKKTQPTTKKIKINIIPFIKHDAVIQECVNSEALLLVIVKTKNNEGLLTYKLFEYIGSKTYILGIGPDISTAKDILQQTNSGKMTGYDDKEKFLSNFDSIYKKWLSCEDIKNKDDISEFSLPENSKKYYGIISNI